MEDLDIEYCKYAEEWGCTFWEQPWRHVPVSCIVCEYFKKGQKKEF